LLVEIWRQMLPNDPTAYTNFFRNLVQDGLLESTGPRSDSDRFEVTLWTPEVRASTVGHDLVQLDVDTRRFAALMSSSGVPTRVQGGWEEIDLFEALDRIENGLRVVDYRRQPSWPRPISPGKGGLEVVHAQQGDSLSLDLSAVGLVLSTISAAPELFAAARAVFRRFPIRIEWRGFRQAHDRTAQVQHPAVSLPSRLSRRITYKWWPDGGEVVVEEFRP
jgi:hypothetical protein